MIYLHMGLRMKKILLKITIVAIAFISIVSCNKSDKSDTVDKNKTVTNQAMIKDSNVTKNHPYITKLTLSLPKNEINRDSTIEAKVVATYSNNTTKDISKNIEWVVSKKDAIKAQNTKLTAIKDYPKPITVEAKVKNSLNKIVTSNKESLKIYWEVNGHRLPPEPDPKVNNATLLGVDSNNNGVRDDVERWIYEEYKDLHPVNAAIAVPCRISYAIQMGMLLLYMMRR